MGVFWWIIFVKVEWFKRFGDHRKRHLVDSRFPNCYPSPNAKPASSSKMSAWISTHKYLENFARKLHENPPRKKLDCFVMFFGLWYQVKTLNQNQMDKKNPLFLWLKIHEICQTTKIAPGTSTEQQSTPTHPKGNSLKAIRRPWSWCSGIPSALEGSSDHLQC